MKSSKIILLGTCLALQFAVGCGSKPVEVVDLNKVLDALVAVLDDKQAAPGETTTVTAVDAADAEVTSDIQIAAIDPAKQDPMKEATFLARYADKLNEVKLLSDKVGVAFTQGGEIVGFRDMNNNTKQDEGEAKEFTVTIDPSNNRLIASDVHGYHRPHSYTPGGGMFLGYMLGSMMGRQNSHYSGPLSGSRPNYTNTPMSPANYHQSAASTVRGRAAAASSSARMRTGSKGFSFGK